MSVEKLMTNGALKYPKAGGHIYKNSELYKHTQKMLYDFANYLCRGKNVCMLQISIQLIIMLFVGKF